jgi:hypothetical protein
MNRCASVLVLNRRLAASVGRHLLALLFVSCTLALAEEDRNCDDALFDPITVSMSKVAGIEALEMVVRTTGLELELNTVVEGNVELAEEYKLGLDVLDEISAQLDLEWTQYGCRVIVTATDNYESSEADTESAKTD